ncbi:MAG: amidohydrolase family protein [Acidimicrobiia bacterium]|nr:amidohydrolase family protein [Acidimicrobiia bacterium]MDH5237956.1 amidohydrolase family protein [Acidimicrobiia bacterium]
MDAGTPEWLAQVTEPVLDPDRPIVDPHHHLWPPDGFIGYWLDDLAADTGSGHNITATVFVECSAGYRTDGPAHLRPVGETEFVAAAAAELTERLPDAPPIGAIVAHADLALGALLDEVLDAHEEAGRGLFRGIRDALASAVEPAAMMIPGGAAPDRYADTAFRDGLRRLGDRDIPYDTWLYHYQLADFAKLAGSVPDTLMVLDHFGTPVGVGRFAGRHDELFTQWQADIASVAANDNVVAKLGGLAMPDNGFGWNLAEAPPSSDEFVAAQQRYYHHAIECFGPQRCMFESNFPVDKMSLSYTVLWNGLKKIAASYSETEQDAMFSGTARRVYRLPD